MKLISQQTLANTCAGRWRCVHYGRSMRHGWSSAVDRKVYEALVALGPIPSPEKVEGVILKHLNRISRSGWIEVPGCDECHRGDHPFVVSVGNEVGGGSDHGEDGGRNLCMGCLFKAVTMCQQYEESGLEPSPVVADPPLKKWQTVGDDRVRQHDAEHAAGMYPYQPLTLADFRPSPFNDPGWWEVINPPSWITEVEGVRTVGSPIRMPGRTDEQTVGITHRYFLQREFPADQQATEVWHVDEMRIASHLANNQPLMTEVVYFAINHHNHTLTRIP